MRNNLPFMRFWGADYFNDTRSLTFEESGVYLKLLWLMWEEGGSLPDDDRVISRMLGIGPRKWRSYKSRLCHLLTYCGKNVAQKRLQKEVNAAIEDSSLRKTKSAKAARARWSNLKENQRILSARSNAQAMPQAMQRAMPQAMLQGMPTHIREDITTISTNSAREAEKNKRHDGGLLAALDGARSPPGAEQEKPEPNGHGYLLNTGYMRRTM